MRHLAMWALALAAAPTLAQSNASLQTCRAVTDATQRLACYDALPLTGAAAPATSSTAPAAPTATLTATPTAPPPAAPDPAKFGFEVKAARAASVDTLETSIEGRFTGWGPKDRIQLANGQVWQVTDDSNAVMNLTNPKVTIRRGALGAFYLELENSNRTARVKRVQ
ncbi:hypothetical protein AACH06_25295 [Ideonella sp. DXS29W]|uniref:Uncharacterized protein n=1 Tax=Ideonella lacteola TaxID=2984193 RepID=A0ABU9BZ82_9BURK